MADKFRIRENVPLAPFTTFGIGGPARWFAEAASEGEILHSVAWARERDLPLFVLGGGSNLLISDAGFPGLVLHVALKGIEAIAEASSQIYRVAAGEDWDSFVQQTVEANCAGIECLAGIPGTVGGTPVQNVGAYGQEVAETIQSVRVLDLKSLLFREFPAADCGFAYRASLFNTTARGRYVVVRVDYRLRPDGEPNPRYSDLQKAFPTGTNPSLSEVATAVRKIRQAKGMLLVDGDPDCRSAGSFFKNPIISVEEFSALTARLGRTADNPPPHYPGGEGQIKLPAAWLIEQAGFPKGYALGRAGISTRHTLALVNLGNSLAAEILALQDEIVAGVAAKFGVRLHMEPVQVGF
jgi:UDP-N-acetylmuramate dehydrogenase